MRIKTNEICASSQTNHNKRAPIDRSVINGVNIYRLEIDRLPRVIATEPWIYHLIDGNFFMKMNRPGTGSQSSCIVFVSHWLVLRSFKINCTVYSKLQAFQQQGICNCIARNGATIGECASAYWDTLPHLRGKTCFCAFRKQEILNLPFLHRTTIDYRTMMMMLCRLRYDTLTD